jgi:hypothetical protein
LNSHIIPLASVTPKNKIKTNLDENGLHIPSEIKANASGRNHVLLPGRYKLPFRIEMNVKMAAANPPIQCTWQLGRGQIYFNGGHTSVADVVLAEKSSVSGDNQLADYVYYSGMPEKEYAVVSATLGSEMMWITVDGTVCYFSGRMPYQEMLRNGSLPRDAADGLALAVCGGTHTQLSIKSITVTEYDDDEPEIPAEIPGIPASSPFELYVRGLPPELHDEVFKTDAFFMDEIKNTMKFKRSIDKHGHLSYKTPGGFHYEIREYGALGWHRAHFIKKPEYTGRVLDKIAESSPDLADRLFAELQACDPHARECARRTPVVFKGAEKSTCAGNMNFRWSPEGFGDLRRAVAAAGLVSGK